MDSLDDAVYMSKESVRKYFQQFCIEIIEIYGGRLFNFFPTTSEKQSMQ